LHGEAADVAVLFVGVGSPDGVGFGSKVMVFAPGAVLTLPSSEAAVVMPWTPSLALHRMIVPAPRKLTPVMTEY
jgi:hypothetical protein